MNSLFTAIYDHFKAIPYSGLYANIGGRLYLNVSPQGATFPHCVYFIVSDYDALDYSDETEEISIQFNIFSEKNSAAEAGNLLEDLKSMFDGCDISVSGWHVLNFQRNFVIPNNDFSQKPFVHGYSVEYDVLLEKLRP